MTAKLEDSLHRSRIERLASCLRRFGLVDRFGLSELLANELPPSAEQILAALRSHPERLPHGTPPQFLAQELQRELESDPVSRQSLDRMNALLAHLKKLQPGDEDAHAYHDLIIELLTDLLIHELILEGKEVRLFQGIKRIDILFRNPARTGFFSRLLHSYRIKSLYVPFECKNYATDPKNPDLDQLSGRLNADTGQFGVLVCRSINDSSAMLGRLASYKRKHEYLIALTDLDLQEMVASLAKGRYPTVFDDRLKELMLA